jgi:hypothetical protein
VRCRSYRQELSDAWQDTLETADVLADVVGCLDRSLNAVKPGGSFDNQQLPMKIITNELSQRFPWQAAPNNG